MELPVTLAHQRAPVVLLQLAPNQFAYGVLGALRTLARDGVPVHVVHESTRSAIRRSRYGTHVAWPDALRLGPGRLVARLRDLASKLRAMPILIATDDVSALFLDAHGDELLTHFRFPHPSAGLARRLADKAELYQLCLEHGIAAPSTVVPRSLTELEKALERARFPLVIKSMDPKVMRETAGQQSVALAHNAAQARALFPRAVDWSSPNLMLQEYVPGDARAVWMYNGYFNAESRCLIGYTGRKLRQHPVETGCTALGVLVDNPEVRATAEHFLSTIGYQGIVDMGFRFDERDGKYKLLDVNPRLGATFRLFVGIDGSDVVRVLYRDLTGQPVQRSAASEGRRWMVEPFDVATALRLHRSGKLGWREWVKSLGGTQELAWFSLDDPLPALAIGARYAQIGLRALRSRQERLFDSSKVETPTIAASGPTRPGARIIPLDAPRDDPGPVPSSKRRGAHL